MSIFITIDYGAKTYDTDNGKIKSFVGIFHS